MRINLLIVIMSRGRPKGSIVRSNIYSILYHSPDMYGYELHKAYCDLFENVTLRNIYYHLSKGVDENSLSVKESNLEKGDYSWGTSATKKRYSLKQGISISTNERVYNYFKKKEHSNK